MAGKYARVTAVLMLAALLAAGASPCSGTAAPFEYMPLVRIPRYYNLMEEGKRPAVRSQGDLETCWAISACSAIESDLLPEEPHLFSPDHMSLQNGYISGQEDGGDYYMIMSYLADWKGPVEEAEDPYADGLSPDGLTASVHVQDIRLLRGMSRRRIMQMILTYGAAQSSLSMDRMRTDSDEYHYYNEETAAYYDPFVEELNHDIVILGWDDAYPRENFRIRPQQDGAWICQNTWGEDFGENGIFYVSYEDRNLFRKGGLVYGPVTQAYSGERVYEQDSLGWLGRQGYGQPSCWFAGVFEAGRSELVTGIGFYTTGPYTAYRICLIPEFKEEADLASAAGAQESGSGARVLAAGQIAAAGFHTIQIPQEIILREGQTYAVAVWISTPAERLPVAVEVAKDRYTQSVSTQGRQTWLSRTGKHWENTQEKYATNVCMKVFTAQHEVIVGKD